MDYSFKQEDIVDWKEMYRPPKKESLEPPIDHLVSDIVGQKVYCTDPRLLTVVLKFKKQKGDIETQDNFTKNPKFIEELRKAFAQPL